MTSVRSSRRAPGRPLLPESHAGGLPPRVAVWGHYYGPNLGDELVTQVVIAALRARRPDASVYCVSLDPHDTQLRHGVPAHSLTPPRPEVSSEASSTMPSTTPSTISGRWRRYRAAIRRRFLNAAREVPHCWSSYRRLRQTDLLVVAGSGQLLDQWRGPWGHPWAVFKWVLLSRLAGTHVAFLSVGAGPIDGWLARRLIRASVGWASYVSVRDPGSARVLEGIGVKRRLPICPDMGFALEVPARRKSEGGATVLGVNPMAHAHPGYWGRGDLTRYEAYLEKVQQLITVALQRGATVRLFSSHTAADRRAIDDLLEAVWKTSPRLAGRLERARVTDVGSLVDAVADCDAVVAARYHSVVLPLHMGIPTAGIAYHPKTVDVMSMAGQSGFCLPDIDAFTAGELTTCVERLLDGHEHVSEDIARHVPSLTAAVQRQFDEVFSLPGAEGRTRNASSSPESERGRHVA